MIEVNADEESLISFKLSHCKNGLIRQQKEWEERRYVFKKEELPKKGNTPVANPPKEMDYNHPAQQFSWELKLQRRPTHGRGYRGRGMTRGTETEETETATC